MPGEKVIYNLHGGGYITFSAHPSDMIAAIARGLLQHVDSVHCVFSSEYRLSSGEGVRAQNPFPAALIDALAGYVYLVNTVKFDPADIILVGDSAGGNLALALTRYLIEHQNSGLGRPQTLKCLA
ncbi:MAG: Alpha/Beta hydrolase protein [Lentinula lateritia]|nr:MAG: Alpha/Beta hydrolase protein [Lentinula lateritia]